MLIVLLIKTIRRLDVLSPILLLTCISSISLAGMPINIICSTDNPKGSLHVVALERFGTFLDEYSNGQLQAVIHYRDNPDLPAIRGEETNMNMVMNGSKDPVSGLKIDVTVIASGNASLKAPLLDFLMLPYFFPEVLSAKRLFESDLMREEINYMLAEKHNIRALAWLVGGFRNMTNSVRPVSKLEDIEGLVIRTPRNHLMKSTYEAFGAQVRPINWNDTYDALKDGLVDGQENPYNVIFYSKFWNAKQQFVTNNSPFLWTGPILMNQGFYASLTKEQQAWVDRAAQEAQQFEWQWIAEQNEYFREQLTAQGMKISDLEDKSSWIEATRPIWDEYYGNIGYGDYNEGKVLVDRISRIIAAK